MPTPLIVLELTEKGSVSCCTPVETDFIKALTSVFMLASNGAKARTCWSGRATALRKSWLSFRPGVTCVSLYFLQSLLSLLYCYHNNT